VLCTRNGSEHLKILIGNELQQLLDANSVADRINDDGIGANVG
jgi:hypothetical protein